MLRVDIDKKLNELKSRIDDIQCDINNLLKNSSRSRALSTKLKVLQMHQGKLIKKRNALMKRYSGQMDFIPLPKNENPGIKGKFYNSDEILEFYNGKEYTVSTKDLNIINHNPKIWNLVKKGVVKGKLMYLMKSKYNDFAHVVSPYGQAVDLIYVKDSWNMARHKAKIWLQIVDVKLCQLNEDTDLSRYGFLNNIYQYSWVWIYRHKLLSINGFQAIEKTILNTIL